MALCDFSPKNSSQSNYPFTLINVFGLKKRFAILKLHFRHYETFFRSNNNFLNSFLLFPVGGKVVFESYVYLLGIFRPCKIDFNDLESFNNSILCIFRKRVFLNLSGAPTWAVPVLLIFLRKLK